MYSIDVINSWFSESSILAEVGNKGFKHNFDVPNPKILVTRLAFVFQCLNLHKNKMAVK